MKYLDQNGLAYFWQKIKNKFVEQESGKGLSSNDYTTTEKNKLNSIATGAEVNQNAFSYIKVGSTNISAKDRTDTLKFEAGSNITLTPDDANNKVTIAATASAGADYILEQGTSGNWFYRKWNSGRYECWYRSPSDVSVACTTAWGSTLYYGTISTVNFPITFIDYPVMSVTVQAGVGGCWAAPDYPSKSATGPIYMYRPTSSTVNCRVNVYAHGKWKQ